MEKRAKERAEKEKELLEEDKQRALGTRTLPKLFFLVMRKNHAWDLIDSSLTNHPVFFLLTRYPLVNFFLNRKTNQEKSCKTSTHGRSNRGRKDGTLEFGISCGKDSGCTWRTRRKSSRILLSSL